MRRSGAALRFGLLASGLILGVACIAGLPFMRAGLPLADDTDTHLSYVQAIVHEISLGDYYPRWLPTLNQGRGSPIFFLQYPLPYMVTLAVYAPLHLLAGGDLAAIAVPLCGIVSVLMVALSGWASYLWLRTFASRAASLAGAVVFMWAPYHFVVDIHRRWAIGEMAGYAAFPLVLLFTRRIAAGGRGPRDLTAWAVAGTILVCSHLITAIMVIPLIVLEAWLACGRRLSTGMLTRFAAAGLAGLLLSAFYLASFASHYRDVHKFELTSVPYGYDDNYLFLPASIVHNAATAIESSRRVPAILKPVGQGALRTLNTFSEDLPFAAVTPAAVFYGLVFTTAAGIICLAVCPGLLRLAGSRAWAIAWLVSIFLQWRESHFVADHLPILKVIQFPWRLSLLTATSLAVLMAYAWDSIGLVTGTGRRRIVGLTAAVIILLGVGNWMVIRKFCFFSHDVRLSGNDSAYQIYAGRPLEKSEERTNLEPFALVDSRPALDSSKCRAERITSREFRFTAATTEQAHLVVNLVCFPGWVAADERTGSSVALGCDSSSGLVTTDIPAGETALRFTLPLHRADVLGPLISAVTAVGLIWFCRKSTAAAHPPA